MAEPIVRKFVIDTTESEQNLKELTVQIQATDAAINSGAQSFENVAAAEQEVVTSTKSLKAQLRELQAQLANTEPDSAKYRELAAAAGELKDRIGDAAEAVGTQAGGALERVSGSLGLVTSRIANLDFGGAAEGAKLLATNIGQVKFSDIAAGIQSLGSSLLAVGRSLLTNPIFLVGGALAAIVVYWEDIDQAIKNLNPELERQRALTAALNTEINNQSKQVGTQISKVNALFNAVTDSNKADAERKQALDAIQQLYPEIFKNQNIDINNTDALTNAKLTLIQAIEAEAKAQAARNLLEQQYAKQFELQVKLQQSQATLSEKQAKEAEIVANSSRKSAAEIQQFTVNIEQAGNATANAAAEVANLQKEVETNAKNIADVEKVAGESIVKNIVDNANKKVDSSNKTTKAVTDNKKKEKDEVIQKENDLTAEILRLREEQYQASLSNQDKELRQVALKYQGLKDQAGTNVEELKALQELERAELQAINDKYFDELLATELKSDEEILQKKREQEALRYELTTSAQQKEIDAIRAAATAKIEIAQGDANLIKIITEQSEAEIQAIKDKYAAEDKAKQEQKAADEKALLQGKLDFAKGILGNIASITESYSKGDEQRAKKAFKVQKAISIAQATIDTYEGAQAAFVSTQKNPVSVLFPAAPYIAAGAAVAAGIANVAAISKQQFQGGTPPATSENPPPSLDGGGGGGGAETAQFNPFASAFLQDRPEQVTPRAYVLAGDVASQQEVRVKVEDLSRIG